MIDTSKPISAVKYNGQTLPMQPVFEGLTIDEWKRGRYQELMPKAITLHTNGKIGASQCCIYNQESANFLYFVESFTHVPHSPLLFIGQSAFGNIPWMTKAIAEELFTNVTWCSDAVFIRCKGIIGDITLPNLEEVNSYDKTNPMEYYNRGGGIFRECTEITGISCPKLKTVYRTFAYGCTKLKTVSLPKCQVLATANNNLGSFYNCTALETVQLGSVGTSCKVYSGYDFIGCSQSGLTITLYCKGELADANLAFLRNGATGATIVIKASEATAYNGTAYSAGDTMITSTVEGTA